MDYFDICLWPYSEKIAGLKKRFWPTTFPFFNIKYRWRKERSLWHLLYTYLTPPDLSIINMSGHLSPYTLKIGGILKKKNKPYIAMIGGMHVSFDDKSLLYYKSAHHIIVHTNLQRKQLLSHPNFRDLDIRVIPLGVNVDLFQPAIQKDNKGIVELLVVSRITRLKQIELAIQAVSTCIKNELKVHLNLIGPISDSSYFNELKALVKQKGLEAFVTFKGAIAHADLVPYYQKADLLLLPSEHESFGMVMIEAMACGTPVVALKGAGGPEEIIQDGVDGILTNITGYDNVVHSLICDGSKLIKLREASRKSVIEKWDINNTVNLFKKSVHAVIEHD